jgi:hypothetical protein
LANSGNGGIAQKANIVTVAIAGLTLITTLVIAWRQHRRQQNAYLVLALTLEKVKHGWLIVHTSLDNRSELTKQIEAVQLLVGPYDEEPEDAANALRPQNEPKLNHLRDIANATYLTKPIERVGRAWMPLRYYTEENNWVADEILACDVAIYVGNYDPGPYSVRLVLAGPKPPDRPKLYRAVRWTGCQLSRVVRRILFRPDKQAPSRDGGLYRVVHKAFVIKDPAVATDPHQECAEGSHSAAVPRSA